MIGTADPLKQTRRPLGRAHLDDTIDTAPIDAKVEAGGADQRAQAPVAHCRFHAPPRLDVERPVVDADRQLFLVGLPQILEDQFGQRAGVAEDKRGLVRLDLLHDLRRGIAARMSGPGNARLGQQDRNPGRRPRLPAHQRHGIDVAIGRQPCAVHIGIGDGR